MFKKRKSNTDTQPNAVKKEVYTSAIIDYLKHDFKSTKIGVSSVILSLFEKNYLTIEQKVINLGTPWPPNEHEIIQLALTTKADPDKLSTMEDHLIQWLIFTLGDGVYTNLTQVFNDIHNKDFKQANMDMFEIYSNKLTRTAKQLHLIDEKPTGKGLEQQAFYQEEEGVTTNSLKLIYGKAIDVNPLLQTLLDLFDQIL